MQHDPTDGRAPHAQLVTMANQIADFFRYQGDEVEAAHNVARHLSHFWALSMRTHLVEHIEQGNDDDAVDPLVLRAVARYRAELTSYGAQVPGEQALEQPKGGGDAG